MNTLITRAFFGAALIFFIPLIEAQEQPTSMPNPSKPEAMGQHVGEPPCGPPPEAYKSCEGKSVGSRSEFADPRGDTVAGVCLNDGSGKVVLRPDHPPSDRGPPPEAYAACVDKNVGGRAQFTGPWGDTVTGTCENEGEKLVLRPDRHPRNTIDDRPGQ